MFAFCTIQKRTSASKKFFDIEHPSVFTCKKDGWKLIHCYEKKVSKKVRKNISLLADTEHFTRDLTV